MVLTPKRTKKTTTMILLITKGEERMRRRIDGVKLPHHARFAGIGCV